MSIRGYKRMRSWLLGSVSARRARRFLIKQTGLDPVWYTSANHDVAASGIDPVIHYLLYGKQEGRVPNPRLANPDSPCLTGGEDVSPADALASPDIPETASPVVDEAPSPGVEDDADTLLDIRRRLELNSLFDEPHYVKSLGQRGIRPEPIIDAMEHYLTVGRLAGASPTMRLDPRYYRFRYPDVARSEAAPDIHFLARGLTNGRWGAHPMSLPRHTVCNSSWGRPIARRRSPRSGTNEMVFVHGDARRHLPSTFDGVEGGPRHSVSEVAQLLRDCEAEFLVVARSAPTASIRESLVSTAAEWDLAVIGSHVQESGRELIAGMELTRDGTLLWAPATIGEPHPLFPVTIPAAELTCINVAEAREVGGLDPAFHSWEYALADLSLRLRRSGRTLAALRHAVVTPDFADIVTRYPVAWSGFIAGDPSRLVAKHREFLSGAPTLTESQSGSANLIPVTAFLIAQGERFSRAISAEVARRAQRDGAFLLLAMTESSIAAATDLAASFFLPVCSPERDGEPLAGIPNYVAVHEVVGSDLQSLEVVGEWAESRYGQSVTLTHLTGHDLKDEPSEEVEAHGAGARRV